MRLHAEANRLFTGEFDFVCRHRAKPANEEASASECGHCDDAQADERGSVSFRVMEEIHKEKKA